MIGEAVNLGSRVGVPAKVVPSSNQDFGAGKDCLQFFRADLRSVKHRITLTGQLFSQAGMRFSGYDSLLHFS